VDIGGQVINPGVYQVDQGTRLYELIDMAGGLTENADTDSINRASFVEDGEKILIPAKVSSTGASAETASSSGEGTASAGISNGGLVNINLANKEELKTLNGIGDVTAEKIIEYRKSNRFKKKEDIKSVKGIGDAIYEKIKDNITC
jgi:competence protein ComEA